MDIELMRLAISALVALQAVTLLALAFVLRQEMLTLRLIVTALRSILEGHSATYVPLPSMAGLVHPKPVDYSLFKSGGAAAKAPGGEPPPS